MWYRAIRACPGIKELYLLAFEYLKEVMWLQELKGVYNFMVERELRIHASLEDIFDEILEV